MYAHFLTITVRVKCPKELSESGFRAHLELSDSTFDKRPPKVISYFSFWDPATYTATIFRPLESSMYLNQMQISIPLLNPSMTTIHSTLRGNLSTCGHSDTCSRCIIRTSHSPQTTSIISFVVSGLLRLQCVAMNRDFDDGIYVKRSKL